VLDTFNGPLSIDMLLAVRLDDERLAEEIFWGKAEKLNEAVALLQAPVTSTRESDDELEK